MQTASARPLTGRGRRRRLVASLSAFTLVANGVVVGVAGTADARPAPIATRIADASSQLSALMTKTEAATEAYNAGRIRLATAVRTAQAATARVDKANVAVAKAQARRQGFAASAYGATGFDKLAAFLSADPQTALDRAGALDALSRRQEEAERTLRAARRDLTAARVAADAALADQKQVLAGLVAQKKLIERQVSQQQALLTRLKAEQAELIRQAKAREAAARAARQRAAAAAAAAAAARAQAQANALAQQQAATATASRQFSRSQVQAPPTPTPAAGGSDGGGTGDGTDVGNTGGGAAALSAAYAELGKPYVWGAAGPDSFDCSGLTQWAWARAGVALDHYTGSQWNQGQPVSRDQLRPGDLVFFNPGLHHVGMYVGGGNMIDAPHTGAVVRVEPIWWDSYAGAIRPG